MAQIQLKKVTYVFLRFSVIVELIIRETTFKNESQITFCKGDRKHFKKICFIFPRRASGKYDLYFKEKEFN